MRNFLKLFKKTPHAAEQDIRVKDTLKNTYLLFQDLLAENNHVLKLMADMEEKLSGEYLFDRQYLDNQTGLVADGVLKIIRSLNGLSHDRFMPLLKIHEEIWNEIRRILKQKTEIPPGPLTLPLEHLSGEMSAVAGGKTAQLGEIRNRLRLPTPDGFAVSAYAFKRFMEHNRYGERINETMSALNIENMEELREAGRKIQDMVIHGEVPEDLKKSIQDSVECLKLNVERSISNLQPLNLSTIQPSPLMVSIRSSAIHEDGEFSFAGQYATFLNQTEDAILQKYKEVIASLFTPRAIFYYKTKGFFEQDMVMAVGVLKMIDARAGGVMYTRDPNNPERDAIIMNSAWGLGKSVVDGTTAPQACIVSRQNGVVLERNIPEQETLWICAPEGGIKQTALPDDMKGKPALSDEEVRTLSRYGSVLEEHYGRPQDIEWAMDRDRRIYILQSRPLRMLKTERMQLSIPRRMEGYPVLLDKGVIACKGIGYGKAFLLKDEKDLADFPEGAVLVARHTSTRFVIIMNKASAIITDVGGVTGHMASLAREYQIPTILDTETATRVIHEGQELTVDAIHGTVYEGKVDKLLKYALNKKEPFKETRLFKTLEKVLKWIVPLNLLDPEAQNFKPEYCRTFHDITRFAHEIAMAEMFRIGEREDLQGAGSIPLHAGIPVSVHLIDMEDGIKKDTKKATPQDIGSIPFAAFLKGMTSMRWPEPRPTDVKGFIGMMAHTATIPEDQLYQAGEKSLAVLSKNYMNFSIRLGYHFSMVEAYAGESINDNYIKFFFKGGGAAADRRLRRVRLIREILKKMDFKVTVTEDVIDAVLAKFKQPHIEERLELMGKLTAYTKQLDMVMYNDAVTDWYVEEFVKEHLPV
ncbi:MAG: PEP/pyruvate-binding domain-containing protein [bacterium]